jgi:hypothetical protein
MNDENSETILQSDHGPSRREFLTRAGMLAGGMALLSIPSLRTSAEGVMAHPAAGSFALELDGQIVDSLKSAEGGFPKAPVIEEPLPNAAFLKKHIGPPRFQDIVIQCNPVMPRPLFDWIAASLNMASLRKNGAIITTNIDRKELSRLQFNNALITEIGFPASDGSSKEPAYLTVKFAPEFTTPLAGSGSLIPMPLAKGQPKLWAASNFRLTIPGLNCSNVSKIEALTIKQTVTENPVGQIRDYQKEPAKLEFPNLVISLAESSAGTFYAWFQDMVIKGNSGENNEKSGTLEFLDPSLKATLLTITFHHLGIFGFTPEKQEANIDRIKQVKVEMYCEQMTLTPGKV